MSCLNKDTNILLSSDSKVSVKESFYNSLSARLSSNSRVKLTEGIYRNIKAALSSSSSVLANENIVFAIKESLTDPSVGQIKAYSNVNFGIKSYIPSISKFKNTFTDKFAGYKPDFVAYEKLYPITDISFKSKPGNTNLLVYKVENNTISSSNIYSSVDEGVFIGDYTKNNGTSVRTSDDSSSIFLTWRMFSQGDLQYKFKVNKPLSVAKSSYFALRASAPFGQYTTKKPQHYKFYDIKLEDPSGNLIIKYEDIDVQGDSYFATYISKPDTNNLLLPTWNTKYPLMDETGVYTLTFNISYNCSIYPFTDNFDGGYEQTCIINKNELTPNPFVSLNISAIEIGNSGGVGILKDNYLTFYAKTREQSDRIEKAFLPSNLLSYNFDNSIYPQVNSVWKTTTNDIDYYNTSLSGSNHLVHKLKNNNFNEYITLINSSPVKDSGKLILKFNTIPGIESYYRYIDGEFEPSLSKAFTSSKLVNYPTEDNFFNVDSLELKVIAKKATGGEDYTIDVVGYSDDKLLNVTSSVNGFIQNSGALDFDTNNVPDISGYRGKNNSLSSSSFSDQSEYFKQDITLKGDHYIINNSPLINSTSFQEYTIPLQIYQNPNQLGKINYANSSMFENLYLDISPIPSGASICSIVLIAYCKPSNGIMLHTVGKPVYKDAEFFNLNLFPISNGTIHTSPKLSGILTGYTSPNYLKTNYSRRWRGNTGNILKRSSFAYSEFGFSFDHEQSNTPFLTSYVDFTNIDGPNIYDHNNNYFAHGANIDVLSNFGWRYSSNQLINGITTPYKSISWLDNIYDSFDRALRIDGSTELETDTLNISNSFVFFIRYTPDKVDTLDLENHLILSNENNIDWGMVLAVEDGYLILKIKDINDNIYDILDNKHISEHSFPLSILITHDAINKIFKLYVDNDDNRFIGSRSYDGGLFYPKILSNPLTRFDYSTQYSDQSPIPMFLHEIGFSSGCNIVSTNANEFLNQINVNDFFDSYNVLGSYVDDDISRWHLGDFKICQFSSAFDFYIKREGSDYLTFNLKHNGSGYSQYVNKPLPSNINLSGVAYHTQIENDFLRFQIANIPTVDSGRFYATSPRISKTLPRGYQFNEEAICVDTVIEHDTFSDMIWPNGKIGPKLIVSLYAPTQDSVDRPSKTFGIVSRSTHYLEPSGCIRKLTSKFTFDNLIDDSEPWSLFDQESYSKEFTEKYFAKDIDSMFLQYDLIYPSGKAINSLIKIHNTNIRLDNAIHFSENTSNLLNLSNNGEKYQYGILNMFVPENGPSISSGINLYISGVGPLTYELNLHTFSSGYYVRPGYLNLNTINYSILSQNLNLYVTNSGQFESISNISLYTSGPVNTFSSLPLYISSTVNFSSGNFILYTSGPGTSTESLSNYLNLNTISRRSSYNAYPSSTMPLYSDGAIFVADINNYTPLFVNGYIPYIFPESGSLPLVTLNYPISASLANSSASINWRNDNVGESINSQDNAYAYVDADDNIRGVDLICYGNCSSYNKCSEAVVDIHGIKWYYPDQCVDGGIFRAKNTYTNLVFPSGSFKHSTGSSGDITILTETNDIIITENNNFLIAEASYPSVIYNPSPYSGHFYGIRKYTGLAPNLPYLINITGRTGSTKAIDIPTEIIEVEYNKNETDLISSDYSGFKIFPHGAYKLSGIEFGKSIASKDDLLAVGCPKLPISYSYMDIYGSAVNEVLPEAGSVFLYRRNVRPYNNSDWPIENYKSSWVLEKVLTLPSGLLKDYSVQSEVDFVGLPFKPTQTNWFVGQEGRQFGHSLDISINKKKKSLGENDQEILIVSGPSAQWKIRDLDYGSPSGVSIGLMVFTDEFQPTFYKGTPQNPYYWQTYSEIIDSISKKDLLFNYFADPRIKFDVKIMICQPIADTPDIYNAPFTDKPDFITLNVISRNFGKGNNPTKTKKIFDDMWHSFTEAFPYDNSKTHNGIPPILGLYIDDSSSLGRESLEPAIDQFIDFYKYYSFSGGLVDSYGERCSGIVIEYTSDERDAENWIEMSKTILSEVLDTGNIIANNYVRFFTNRVGIFNTKLAEFNVPPESGGRVYVFEKESGSWNLIQEIKSPNITYKHPDRFGHSVSISDDGDVIAVGSPYIQESVMVYEKKPEQKDTYYALLKDWVKNNHADKYAKEIEECEISGNVKQLYLALDPSHKFKSRVDLGIEEYQAIYSFGTSNMQPIGSWTFITDAVAPTPRLGYSVDVNEDGSIVVASSPTDSLNVHNDADIYYGRGYYKGKNYTTSYSDPFGQIPANVKASWSSSVNAGSIHVFESRKYYPHNKVIEYGRFGNLHENISNNTPDSGHFHYLENIFSDKNFTKTPFDRDSEIPIDAGLVFIITPAIDALSDEIFDNISNWLALGDRNLVLVGNDPIWERGGIYKHSNDIINKLLERLESRMRIVPARSQYESLPNISSTFSNIIPSFVPQGSTSTYVERLSLQGSGVADIKIYKPGYFEQMPCSLVTDCGFEQNRIQIQTKCEMPLMHYGDLRAQWNMLCCDSRANTVIYGFNWPLVFGSYVPRCADEDFPNNPMKNFEPIPLLVAAEQVDQVINYPEVPAQYDKIPIYETKYAGETYFDFGDSEDDALAFAWDANSNLYNNLNLNVTNNFSKELFYQPPENGILQAKAIPRIDITPYIEKIVVSEKTHFAIEYSLASNSQIIVLAGVSTESQSALYSGAGDQNAKFYINLVSNSKTLKNESTIAQLGGWTGRDSFKAANPNSILASLFSNSRNDVVENVLSLDSLYNVAWIANPDPLLMPSDDDVNNIKSWLSSGNKKLIITYDENIESAKHVENICKLLGINVEIMYLENLNQYPKAILDSLDINSNHQVGGKFFLPRANKIEHFYAPVKFYPLKLVNGTTSLVYFNSPVYDEIPKGIENQIWNVNAGIVKLNVPAIAGSGYKIFVTTASDSPVELLPIDMNIDNVSVTPKLPYPDNLYEFDILELNDSSTEYINAKSITTGFTQANLPPQVTKVFKVQAAADVDSINIYFSSAILSVLPDVTYRPKTIKIMGVSGVLIPVYEKVAVTEVSVPTDQYEYVKKTDAIPASTETFNVTRAISTDNTKYCRDKCKFLGGQLIEDGPVVAAQEIEILSSFNAGVARSRITVLTDSSMIQGRFVANENGVIPNNTYSFIRSLYPETDFSSVNYGRQFDVYNKLVSPERGSPTKYFAQYQGDQINVNFGGIGTANVQSINKYESSYDPEYVVRPKLPWIEELIIDDEEKIKEIKTQLINQFLGSQNANASTAKFSGIIDGTMYADATVAGGLPQLLKDKGYDYLDFEKFPSGYPGDLFGYSVCIRGKTILVGSPFSAFGSENITPWDTDVSLHIGQNGGAGSVYMFEKSGDASWACVNKFRPQSLMGELSGINQLSDQFGHSIAMENDTIIIGAPNHKYNTYYENIFEEDAAFARKNFNTEFRIPERNKFDLGLSGNRILLNNSGIKAHNAGAIYLYENKITDWENKKQSWRFVEKVVSDSTFPSGERFGRTINLTRPYRTDADYTIFAGCNFASGEGLINLGATYIKDVMLRNQAPSLSNPNAWISAKVFGSRDKNNDPTVSINFDNVGNNVAHNASGEIISNFNGEIFIEVSGQDPSTKGFIAHRPYIESIIGNYQYGTIFTDNLPLFCNGYNLPPSSQMPLFIDVENSAYVYNTLGLYADVISGVISDSGLNLFTEAPSGVSYEYLNLYTPSGIGSHDDNLKLSIRGK